MKDPGDLLTHWASHPRAPCGGLVGGSLTWG